MKRILCGLLFVAVLFSPSYTRAQQQYVKVTNEMIYQKLIEIEKRQAVLEAEFKAFREETNRRFEDVSKRFEELREDMNKRFEAVDKRFEDINKRFEDINKRFEDINKRFNELINFLWMITAIFTTLTLGVIGFAYWDRRTIIRKSKEETLEEIERKWKPERIDKLVSSLRELAKKDAQVAEVLKKFNLL
jgi:Skp family chaperone for outer membrane proteins